MIRFLLVIGVAAVAMIGGVKLAASQEIIPVLPSYFLESTLFLTLSTAFIYAKLYRAEQQNFTPLYLLTIAVKIIGYVIFIGVVIKLDPPAATPNLIFFMVSYLLFTAIEIAFLFRRIST